MPVLEHSISVIIVSIIQLIGFAMQTFLVRKKLKESIFNHTFFFAVFIVLFNCSILFLPIEIPFVSSAVFVLLGAYYASIRMEQLFETRIGFFIGYSVNATILFLAISVLHRLKVVSVVEQMVIITFVLTAFYMVSGAISIIKRKTSKSLVIHLLTAILFTSVMMVVLLFGKKENIGILGINLFFLGLVFDSLVSQLVIFERKGKLVAPDTYTQHFTQYGLSKAQFEVIKLLAQDLDIPKIALALDISTNAVETRLSRIYKKTPYKSIFALKVALVKLSQTSK